jgi:hypothetical protein
MEEDKETDETSQRRVATNVPSRATSPLDDNNKEHQDAINELID